MINKLCRTVLVFLFAWLFVAFISVPNVEAACTITSTPEQVQNCSEDCWNTGRGSVGDTCYSCYYDEAGVRICYNHGYACDSPCGGGGGGGGGGGMAPGQCPNGFILTQDPAFASRNPPYTSCQRSGCLGPSVFDYSDVCGYDSRGRDKFRCYHYICVPCAAAPPAAPTLNSPADGNQQSNTSATLLWNATTFWGLACTGANNQYQVFLEAGDTTPDTIVATVNSGTLSNTQNNLINGTTYYWKVRANNGQLSTDSATRSFTILDNQIIGTVYDDVDGVCSPANPSNLGGGLGVTWGTDSSTVNANGTFTITATGANPQNLSLTGVPASYVCSPGCGNCPTRSGISYPSNNNFFLTQSREAWWQASGAGVYAGTTGAGTTIRSLIPSPSTRLIIPGTNGLAALVRASSGAPEIGAATQVSETNWSAVSRYKGKRMDYQFFAAQMGLTSSSADDFVGDNLVQPVSEVGKDFWYQEGDATINDPWTVNSGESYVLLVNGNLQINANITVASGGFLAVISNGGITVSPDVTSLQGLYVMDELFTTETGGTESDAQLAIQGSIVTWGGVSLLRDLGASLNVTTPAERFSYRPDLITNMPEKMKVFALRWQEVSPGTFGE